jgi:hypothetical protein
LWKQDGNEIAGRYCSDREINVSVGDKSIVTVEVENNRKLIKKLSVTVEPKDLFIAVIGDSYVSGESNPHLKLIPKSAPDQQIAYPAIWWDVRCHRSMVSGPVQASALLAERHHDTSVTFVSYACSGAEISDGVLTKFEGRETVQQIKDLWTEAGHIALPPDFTAINQSDTVEREVARQKPVESELKPQIDRLNDVLCPPQSQWTPNSNCAVSVRKRPDILIVSIGGNDIGFGEIGRRILLSDTKDDTKEAREKWLNESKEDLRPQFENLGKEYSKLAVEIRARINPKRTILVDYMDPSQYRAESGRDDFCGKGVRGYDRYGEDGREYSARIRSKDKSSISFFKNNSLYNLLVTRDEAKFSQWMVHELNRQVKNGAAQKWNAEDRGAEVFELQDLKGRDGLPRGICARNSWFTGIFESWNRQGWIPTDENHWYPLKLNGEKCPYPPKGGECRVPAGNVTSGVLHPNFFGHYNVGRVMLLKMEGGSGP